MSVLDELYRETLMRHYKHPHHYGELEGATLEVQGDNPSCGDRVRLMLRLEGDRVAEVRFVGQGCAISTASASRMTDVLQGKTVSEALRLARQFKAVVVDGTPPAAELGELGALAGVHKLPARVKCATLVWNALEEALSAR